MPEIIREQHIAEKVVIVDGQFGCGKTMLSPIIAALDKVELLAYLYELEYTCFLNYIQKIEDDAAVMLVRMMTDLQIYNRMMSRETNFRPSDLSSVFKDAHPWRYIKRLFQAGDQFVPERIKNEKPILHLTTHNLVGFSKCVFEALGERAVLIEVVRHPLYKLKQQMLNMQYLVSNIRDFNIYYRHKDQIAPYYAINCEEKFMAGNDIEKAIYSMQSLARLTEEAKASTLRELNAQIITIPFEQYVVQPWGFMKQIEDVLGTRVSATTRRIMKKQNVPRAMYAQGVNLKIYRRYGWKPPQAGSNEIVEFETRRQLALDNAGSEALGILDDLSRAYEEKYLGGIKKLKGRN